MVIDLDALLVEFQQQIGVVVAWVFVVNGCGYIIKKSNDYE